jgi:hypothetical protein
MKKLIITSILALLITGAGATGTQDRPDEYLGLPGDNLNLYAVMKLFQESETLEAFEKNLNDENSRINNLDLNGDNLVDYITVSDYVDGNIHTIVLRAMLSRNESQDVAVFTVEKLRNGEVRIQLIGDEALYGQHYIIEPNYAETPNPGYAGARSNVTVVTTTYYDVAAWPVIRFIFFPGYVVWRSSWYWGYYPFYWHPWRPWYWHYYYGYHYHWYPYYYGHYLHHNHYHYYAHYHDHYYKHIRYQSPSVYKGIREGRYNATYSRPDQRREGEALYARTSSNPNTRTRTSTSVRTTAPAGNRTLSNPRTTTTQRSTSPSVNREAARPSTTPRTTPTQRSTAPSVNREAARPSTTPRTTTTQRSTAPVVHREASKPASTQRSTTTRSSSPAVSQRPASRSSASVHRSAPARSSGSSAPKTVSRSSSQSGRSAASSSRSSASRSSSSSNGRRK